MAGTADDWEDAEEVIEAGAFDGVLPATVPVRFGQDGPVIGEAAVRMVPASCWECSTPFGDGEGYGDMFCCQGCAERFRAGLGA